MPFRPTRCEMEFHFLRRLAKTPPKGRSRTADRAAQVLDVIHRPRAESYRCRFTEGLPPAPKPIPVASDRVIRGCLLSNHECGSKPGRTARARPPWFRRASPTGRKRSAPVRSSSPPSNPAFDIVGTEPLQRAFERTHDGIARKVELGAERAGLIPQRGLKLLGRDRHEVVTDLSRR